MVAADGADVYLPATDNLRLPIAFLHGEHNRLFKPEGSQLTYDYLSREERRRPLHAHGGPRLRTHGPVLGKDAARDVYPVHRRARPVQLTAPHPTSMASLARTKNATQGGARCRRSPHASHAGPLQLPADVGPQERRTRRVRAGRLAQGRPAELREQNEPAPLTPARGGDPDRLAPGSPARSCTTGRSTSPTAPRARHDVPQRRRPRRQQRRQRAGARRSS